MVDQKTWALYERNYHKIREEDLALLIQDLESRTGLEQEPISFIKKIVKVGAIIHLNHQPLDWLLLDLYNAAELGVKISRQLTNYEKNKTHFLSYAAELAGELCKSQQASVIDWAVISYEHFNECINSSLKLREYSYARFNLRKASELAKDLYNNEGLIDHLIKEYEFTKELIKQEGERKSWKKKENIILYHVQLNECLSELVKETSKSFWLQELMFNDWRLFKLTGSNVLKQKLKNDLSQLISKGMSLSFAKKFLNIFNQRSDFLLSKAELNNYLARQTRETNYLINSYFDYLNAALNFENFNQSMAFVAYRKASKKAYEVFKARGWLDWLETSYDLRVKTAEINNQSRCFDEYYAGKTALKLYDKTKNSIWLSKSWRATIKSFNEFNTFKHKVEAHRQLEEIIYRLKDHEQCY